MIFTLLTNDPVLADRADRAGIERIGPDFETLGKQERQRETKSWISDHRFEDLPAVRDALRRAELFVRTNPVHDGLKDEIDTYIETGAQVLMLPMVRSAQQAETFVALVGGRAKVSLLVETPAGAMRLHEIVEVPGIHDIHIGLNDMSLGMRLGSHFEVLASDFMIQISKIVRDAGIIFGFGGVGRLHDDRLPIPSDLVYAQYALLHGESALISRVFTSGPADVDLAEELAACRKAIEAWRRKSRDEQLAARAELRRRVQQMRDASTL